MIEIIPFFSVVIPTYNRAQFIVTTIQSVLAQHFQEFEVLIVDDGSTDDTATVLHPLLSDNRVRYLPKENAERGAARNYGFRHARGQYVVFLDSDDQWLPHHLAVLYEAILAQQQPNFIASKFNLERAGKQIASDINFLPMGYYGLDLLLHGNPLACNFAVRRQNEQVILFEEDRQYASVEDWMFLLQNMQYGTFYLVDEVTIVMNDHDARSMRADHRSMVRRWLKLPDWVDTRLALTSIQRQQLVGHFYYLCAIHAYAAGAWRESLRYALQTVPSLSLRQAGVLLVRCAIGVEAVGLIKKVAPRR